MLRKRDSGINNISTEISTPSTDHTINLAISSSPISSIPVPPLLVSSRKPSSVLVFSDTQFEISNTNNLEFSELCGLCKVSTISHSSQFFKWSPNVMKIILP